MSVLPSLAAAGFLLFSSTALASDRGRESNRGHHRPDNDRHAAAVVTPAASHRHHDATPGFSINLDFGNIWVNAYWDHHGVYHAGYYRPSHRHGWVWVEGYRDHHGYWHEGYWRRV